MDTVECSSCGESIPVEEANVVEEKCYCDMCHAQLNDIDESGLEEAESETE